MTDTAKLTWVVQQAGVMPRTFLLPDRTWGSVAAAEEFATEEEAMLIVCPDGSTGLPMRMSHHAYRADL